MLGDNEPGSIDHVLVSKGLCGVELQGYTFRLSHRFRGKGCCSSNSILKARHQAFVGSPKNAFAS